MRQFIKRALQKLDRLGTEQVRELLVTASAEIDRLETVLDSQPRGVLVCDIANNLILANKSARRSLSVVSYEQAKVSVWSVIPDELIAEFLAHTLLAADNAEEREFDTAVKGQQRLLSISVMPLVQDRQVSGSLIVVDDITERRSREAKMRRMENLASLTTLAAGVAHEIKNPLGSLSIHVQLIQKAMKLQEKLCSEQHRSENECEPGKHFSQVEKYLNVVNEEIERLNRIVVDFLFAVRPMNAELRKGDINVFITELAEFVSFELKNAHIEFVLNLADNLPLIDFDARLMKQAFLNLIQNAEAAMSGGGKLSFTTELHEDQVLICIADTGTGILEENLAKIFEPYFTTKVSGSGLGLTMVFKIIKEHQGEISVKSREGEGTVFFITLPIPQTDRRLLAYEIPEAAASQEAAASAVPARSDP